MAYNRDRAPKEDNGPEMIEKVVYLLWLLSATARAPLATASAKPLKFPKQS